MISAYQVEQPSGTLTTSGTAYSQVYLGDSAGNVFTETDLSNDNATPITCAVGTPEWSAGDSRTQKQWLDTWLDIVPVSGMTVTPVSGGSTVGTVSTVGASTSRALPPLIVPIGNPGTNFLGVILRWSDNFAVQSAPTQLFEWSEECVQLPVLIRSWQSVPTSHGLQGYQFIYRIRFAYLTKGANNVSLAITAFDGTSPAVITLPGTNGAYQKAEFVPTFNKGMLYTYAATSSDQFAPILEDCEVLVGQWNRSGPCAVFQGLGGLESI
jgi:hypothetical protein